MLIAVCVIPVASCFTVWQKMTRGTEAPFFISRKDPDLSLSSYLGFTLLLGAEYVIAELIPNGMGRERVVRVPLCEWT